MDAHLTATLGLSTASLLLFVLAWLIGVGGNADLISNYRAHPERYPDAAGLTRWMGLTLGAGALSFAVCALTYATHAMREDGVATWCVSTGTVLVVLAFSGLARYRRMPPDKRGR
jgi:hypothetical protein